MASKKDGDGGSSTATTVLWVAGTAAVTWGVAFYVNRYLKEKDELRSLRYQEEMKAMGDGGGSKDGSS